MNDIGDILALLSESKSPQPILFIGAGLSCEIGFPSWGQLMAELIDLGVEHERLRKSDVRLLEDLMKTGEYLAAGEVLRGKLGRLVDDYLRKRFDTSPGGLGSYEYLMRLPFAGIVTTNYDASIETAYAKHFGSPLLTLYPEENAHMGAVGLGKPFLLKLHGDARRGNGVLSASDYAAMEQNQALQSAVSSLFFGHPVVFLGYGLSDRDILTPLSRLKLMYSGASTQKIALLPSTIPKRERTRLEEDFRIDIVTYDRAGGHKRVGSLIRQAFLRHESGSASEPVRSSADFTEVFTFDPALFRDQLIERVKADLAYLNATSTRWGAFVGSEPRAANIAEMLLAMSASRAITGDSTSGVEAIHDLLRMIDSGRVKSLSLAVTNLQTQALAVLALVRWRDLDEEAAAAYATAAAWLLARASPEGWPRFEGDEEVSLVTTLSALTALTVAGYEVEVEPIWREVRVRLAPFLAEESRREHELIPVIAGWASSYLHERWMRLALDPLDVALRDRALDVLTDPNVLLDDSIEPLPYTEETGIVGWRSWRHPTASICVLGLAPWLAECGERPIQSALGRCFSQLLTMSTPENSAEKFLFPMMYRVMAVARYVEAAGAS